MDLFQFDLPEELIAQAPAQPRDHARLLVYNRQTSVIKDSYFYDLPKFLPAQTSLVLNNSRVEKCRLRFAKHEVFVLETVNPTTVVAMVWPGKKFQLNDDVQLAESVAAKVVGVDAKGLRTLQFDQPLDDSSLEEFRQTPFPPYVEAGESLSEEYQTVYAKVNGSKAAPTAGLHFTPELLKKIAVDHDVIEITLDVGLGTFASLKPENIASKTLHEEHFAIDSQAALQLNKADNLTAVGTTTTRCLESAYQDGFTPTSQKTDIFIQPGYQFKAVDQLITNFHLPGTSLLMMVEAFLGSRRELERIYSHAIQNQYRFYSFGDAMLIL